MAIEDVKNAGGVPIGDTIYEFELIACNNKGTAEGGATAAKRLVYEDNVKFIPVVLPVRAGKGAQPITE